MFFVQVFVFVSYCFLHLQAHTLQEKHHTVVAQQQTNACLQTLYSPSGMPRRQWINMLSALCQRPETHGNACQEIFENPQQFDAGMTVREQRQLLEIFCS